MVYEFVYDDNVRKRGDKVSWCPHRSTEYVEEEEIYLWKIAMMKMSRTYDFVACKENYYRVCI